MTQEYDYINPKHYQLDNGLEAVDILKAVARHDGLLWNCLKYLIRVGKKPGESRLRDLQKARWYLNELIKEEEESIIQT